LIEDYTDRPEFPIGFGIGGFYSNYLE